MALGEASLSKAELLAILLRVGVEGMSAVQLGHTLLHSFSGLRGLHAASAEELCAINGMGPAKTAQIGNACKNCLVLSLIRPDSFLSREQSHYRTLRRSVSKQ